tara:strand:+ start:3612 stop:3800 length:189 start_codon:yes stop_codon:yes gene_type:complete
MTVTAEQLLTFAELAALLHVSRSTASRMLKAGNLPPHVRVGMRRRWRRRDVASWLDTQGAGK